MQLGIGQSTRESIAPIASEFRRVNTGFSAQVQAMALLAHSLCHWQMRRLRHVLVVDNNGAVLTQWGTDCVLRLNFVVVVVANSTAFCAGATSLIKW